MKDLKDYTKEELEEELRHRNLRESLPKPLGSIGLSSIIKQMEDYMMDCCINGLPESLEHGHDIFVATMEAIYGPNIINWLNSNSGKHA